MASGLQQAHEDSRHSFGLQAIHGGDRGGESDKTRHHRKVDVTQKQRRPQRCRQWSCHHQVKTNVTAVSAIPAIAAVSAVSATTEATEHYLSGLLMLPSTPHVSD